MPPIDNQTKMRPSLLDRLADPEAFSTMGSVGFTFEKMKSSIKNDVTDLLNSRLNVDDVNPDSELHQSILMFGLPDIVSFSGNSEDQARTMARQVQRILERFEPRLRNIKVQLLTKNISDPREVRFQIDAVLNVAPFRDLVGFETVLELTTGRAKVSLEGEDTGPKVAVAGRPKAAGERGT